MQNLSRGCRQPVAPCLILVFQYTGRMVYAYVMVLISSREHGARVANTVGMVRVGTCGIIDGFQQQKTVFSAQVPRHCRPQSNPSVNKY